MGQWFVKDPLLGLTNTATITSISTYYWVSTRPSMMIKGWQASKFNQQLVIAPYHGYHRKRIIIKLTNLVCKNNGFETKRQSHPLLSCSLKFVEIDFANAVATKHSLNAERNTESTLLIPRLLKVPNSEASASASKAKELGNFSRSCWVWVQSIGCDGHRR